MKEPREILEYLKAADFLTQNFPDNILIPRNIKSKTYSSVFDFIMDIMKSLGVEPMEIVYLLMSHITGVSRKLIENYQESMDEIGKIDFGEDSPFLNAMEVSAKFAIQTALSGFLSCSANPIIEDRWLDARYTNKTGGLTKEGGIMLNISEIDPMGFLDNCPSSINGKNFYFDNEEYGINSLYKSMDFNAFLWYAIHKGELAPQYEVNKCMWDNRYTESFKRDDEQWKDWLQSKKTKFYNINDINTQLIQSDNSNIKPILQIQPIDDGRDNVRIQLSSQNYFRTRKLWEVEDKETGEIMAGLDMNKTLYEFNKDYLDSIKLFSAKTFIVGFMNQFMNGILKTGSPISIQEEIYREKIRLLIKKVIQHENTGIEDCYFTFSNDEYNMMLETIESRKFNAKPYFSATKSSVKLDKDKIEKTIDNLINPDDPDVTLHDERESIMDAIIDVSTIETETEDGTIKFKFSENWLSDFFSLIMEEIMMPIFTPRVILLFAINAKEMGFPENLDNETLNKLFIGVTISVVKVLLEMLIKFVFEFLFHKIMALLIKYKTLKLMEKIEDYIRLLDSAMVIIRINFNSFENMGIADNIDYADIVPEKITPNSQKTC